MRGIHAPQRATGYTLLEIMVVLALLALTIGLLVPGLGGSQGTELRSAAQELVTGLRFARTQAVTRGRSVTLTLDVAGGRFRISDSDVTGRLPADIALSLYTARTELSDGHTGAIRFFPDGTSTGGRISLKAPNGSSQRIDVDWLTGRVRLEQEPAPDPVDEA